MDKKNDAVRSSGLTADKKAMTIVDEVIHLYGSKPLKAEWFAQQPKRKRKTKKTIKETKNE